MPFKDPDRYREYQREYQRKWRAANRGIRRGYEYNWRERHREWYLAYMREYNPKYIKENLDKLRVRNQNRRARKRGNGGSHTQKELIDLFDKQEGRCFYCGDLLYASFDREIHTDHKTPISRGGTSNIDNIALACSECNLAKHAMTAEEFLSREHHRPRIDSLS